MKSITGPVAVAAIAAAFISFTAPAAEARSAAHGASHGGGMSIPYIGRIPGLGSLRHGSIPTPRCRATDRSPHLGSHLGSLRRLGSICEPGSLRNLGSLGRSARLDRWVALGGLGGFGGVVRRRRPRSRRRLRMIDATG